VLFDVYGRYRVYVDADCLPWLVDGDGGRSSIQGFTIPPDADGEEMIDLLDVAFHEYARPGDKVIQIS